MVNRAHRIYAGDVLVEENQREYDWDTLRRKRDRALADTDWRAVKDRTMSQAWKDFRQALRDLPQDHDTANDAADNWPEALE